MIYVSKKLKYLFDTAPAIVDEDGIELSKFIYENANKSEVENIPYEDWNVIHKNGEYRDCRKENLELVIFVD